MPIIDSMAQLRSLSQAQGSFILLAQNNIRLTTSTTKTHFWQLSQRAIEKKENQTAAERVRDSVCAHCGKAMGSILFNRYIGEKSLKGALHQHQSGNFKVKESLIRKIEQDKSRKKSCFHSVKTGYFAESMRSVTKVFSGD